MTNAQDFKDIQTIGKEMAAQNNRATQYPLFVIQVDVKRYVNYLDSWEYRERPNTDLVNDEDFIGGLCEIDEKNYKEYGTLLRNCDDCEFDTFVYYNLESEFDLAPGVFFTAKACELHIKENYHQYRNPRVYGISAWRNYEMQAVMREVIRAGESEIPSHYE